MLIEIAVGDSYGAGFEYAPPSGHRQNDLKCFYSHPKWRQPVGSYTDDTEMSIALAELLVENQRWNPLNITQKFVEVFKRNGQRTGYAKHFYDFLCSVADGKEFLARIKPDSEKSGAAMRACPLGVIPDINKLLNMCEVQARITHNTDNAVCAAQAVSLMTHYFIYDLGPRTEVGNFLEDNLQGKRFGHDLSSPWSGKVHPPGLESAHAAIHAVQTSDCMTDILKKCVDFGGDVDTVAAIACGAASGSQEILQDTPENLILTLENGAYGKDYLVELDKKLLALIEKPPSGA